MGEISHLEISFTSKSRRIQIDGDIESQCILETTLNSPITTSHNEFLQPNIFSTHAKIIT
jgi:hypothetical protein